MKTVLRLVTLTVLAVALAASWDFLAFVQRVDAVRSPANPERADAIAALTGGSDARIVTAIQLERRLGLPLLISGVHVDTRLSDIARIADTPEQDIECCVTLGRAAATTEGNGFEVADWARRIGVKRIVVVTSDYHMDRALVELRRAMPEGEFMPYAVPSSRLRVADWYRDTGSARLLTSEWLKYRIASVRAQRSPGEPLTDGPV